MVTRAIVSRAVGRGGWGRGWCVHRSRGVAGLVNQRSSSSVLLVVYADGTAIDELVFGSDDRSCVFLPSGASVKFDGLVDHRRHAEHSSTLDKRLEFDDGGESIACSPRLVRDHDGVHELLRPSVLYLEGLLILESFGSERTSDRDRELGLKIMSETGPNCDSTKLVQHGCATKDAGTDA